MTEERTREGEPGPDVGRPRSGGQPGPSASRAPGGRSRSAVRSTPKGSEWIHRAPWGPIRASPPLDLHESFSGGVHNHGIRRFRRKCLTLDHLGAHRVHGGPGPCELSTSGHFDRPLTTGSARPIRTEHGARPPAPARTGPPVRTPGPGPAPPHDDASIRDRVEASSRRGPPGRPGVLHAVVVVGRAHHDRSISGRPRVGTRSFRGSTSASDPRAFRTSCCTPVPTPRQALGEPAGEDRVGDAGPLVGSRTNCGAAV